MTLRKLSILNGSAHVEPAAALPPTIPGTIDKILFGSDDDDGKLFIPEDPTLAGRLEKRRELINRFRVIMADYGATDAQDLWNFLCEAHERYDAVRDGHSDAMALVEEIKQCTPPPNSSDDAVG